MRLLPTDGKGAVSAATPRRLAQKRVPQLVLPAGLMAGGVLAVAGLPAILWFHAQPIAAPLPWVVMLITGLPAALLAWWLATRPVPSWQAAANLVARCPDNVLVAGLVGLLLRLAVLFGLSPAFVSDGGTYLKLAQQLVHSQQFGEPGAWAYWPPGFPLLLAPWFSLGWSPSTVVAVVNALCLAGALGGARALMQQLGLSRCRGLVFWGIALWPGHVLCAGLPEKELVITALLPWILAWALRSRVTGWPAAALAGALLGLAVLVQPSLQFLPLGVLAGVLLWSPARKQDLVSALVALLAMVAVVAPWSWRNHNVLGEVVAVSTNGGDVLYRANNELATGVYTARAAVVLDALSELDRDRESKRLAWRWILGHPVSFAQLAASKLLHFMGDDSYGAYAVFSRGQVPLGRPAYLLVRQASALPWLLAWLLMLGWVGPPRAAQAGAWLLVAWPLLYLAAIHAVFESGPKYHLPLLVPFLVLLAQAGSRRLAVRP